MDNNIKISVVTPVYNMSKFLNQNLDSLVNQTLENIEIICVDDGSRDNSLDILNEYGKKDMRVKVIINTVEGVGAGCARNTGLKLAKGEYILIVDSDDYFHLEMLEKIYSKAVETNADIVMFDADKFDSDTGNIIPTNQFLNTELLPNKEVFTPSDVADNIFQLADGVAWNKLIKRDLINKNQLEFFPVHVIDDMYFTFCAFLLAEKITVVNEKLLFYRFNNSSSQMANVDRDSLAPEKVLTLFYNWLNEKKMFQLYKNSFTKRSVTLCIFYLDEIKEQENFFKLYDYLHNKGLKELEIIDKNGLNETTSKWVEDVINLDGQSFIKEQKSKELNVIKSGYKCGIYGFGARALNVFNKIQELNGEFVAIADSSEQKQGQEFQGKVVISPKQLDFNDIDVILISTPNYFAEIKENLISLGFKSSQIALI